MKTTDKYEPGHFSKPVEKWFGWWGDGTHIDLLERSAGVRRQSGKPRLHSGGGWVRKPLALPGSRPHNPPTFMGRAS